VRWYLALKMLLLFPEVSSPFRKMLAPFPKVLSLLQHCAAGNVVVAPKSVAAAPAPG
jgi:hypothetical protein